MTEGTPNLRELNKRRTREAISTAATRLFIERGFDRTTIAEVAVAAGVAKMTVTNHFPRKEDLVLDLHEEIVAGQARTVAGRAPGESALAALRGACLAAIDRHDPALGFSDQPFARTVSESPALLARLREIHEQSENALAAALAEATDSSPWDLTARLAAGLLAAIHRALFTEVFRRVLAGEEHETISDAIRPSAVGAFDQLRGALDGYAVRPAG
ncbi:TetR/AcrR family transcriptional regulator [Kitasatospora sp. NPDC091207]|uniref:TetR/AcrR family transcriptional regulator n=1 Tax=Kitasatospora sp. NPDC091207 TaxID=3364083 RepID=UPI003827253D